MRRPVLLAVILFALGATAAARPKAYFSLTTDRTFLPGEKINFRLYANDVDALEFRVYHVNDPVVFFEQVEDSHNFGHYAQQEQIDKPTVLERFHDWKQSLWTDIRQFFREQYSAPSRAQIRESTGRARKSQIVNSAIFAQVPVLNSKQLVARWRQDLPPKYFGQAESVPINSLGRGVYLVEATDGDLRAYTIVVVSELAVVTKTAPSELLAFTVNRRTGAPVSGAKVLVWEHKQLSTGVSDANGLTKTAVPEGKYEQPRTIAVHGDDAALVSLEYGNLSSNPNEDWDGYMYTDRPIYRPGHTVHFKGILRRRSGEKYILPPGKPVNVVISDPQNKDVFQESLTLSQTGTLHGDFELPKSSALGYYSVSARLSEDSRVGGGFRVEEYKKPEYEVKVTPDKPHVIQGETINAIIDSRYFFGEPVVGAEVHYVVHTTEYWSPYFEHEEDQGEMDIASSGEGEEAEGGEAYGGYAGQQISEQKGKLGTDGRLRIQLPTTPDPHHHDVRYRIEARVTDEGRREISGAASAIATYGSFRVGITPDSYVYRKGEQIKATVVARDYDGKPVQTKLHIELFHPQNDYTKEVERVISNVDTTSGPDGSGTVQLVASESQSLRLRVSATTPEARSVEDESWLWVIGNEASSWAETGRQIRLVADKKSYQPGDIAHVLVMSNVSDAYVLVTSEARTIQTQRVVRAEGNSLVVEVPVKVENQPNFFVSALFVKNNEVYQGSKNLKVPATQQKLDITIEPSRPQFQPGAQASYTILAKDWKGNPVSGDFSIGVVDEAIYAIQPDDTLDITSAFFGNSSNRVVTESSFTFSFNGEAGNRPMILAANGHDRLAQLKPSEPLIQPKIRKAFPDTAFWSANLHTDKRGRATAQFTFPDSLTTWRATVRGVTADTKVGTAIQKVIVRKNLMVRLAVPRFFRQGDEVTVSAIVHNYLSTDTQVHVSLATKGLDTVSGSEQVITVPSKADQRVDWHLRAQSVHEAVLTATALTNAESDAMELTLPVIPFGVRLADSKSGGVTTEPQQTATVNLPGSPDQSSPSLDISVSPSISGGIFGALGYLTSYPYGCTEQTMSSFLPNVIVARAMKDLGVGSGIDTDDLRTKIKAGLDRLYDFQHDDGGWGWWKEDTSLVFMTAYVVSGLAQAQAAGYDIDTEKLKKSEQYLQGMLRAHTNIKDDLQAYVVYALTLSGASDAEMLRRAVKARDNMSVQGLAMIGLALQQKGDQSANEIADMIEKKATVSDREAYWPSSFDYFMEFSIDDGAETTAEALRFLSLVRPASPLLPKAAFWLVNHRNGGYFWDSTKQTAMVVFGLTEYLKRTHEFDADFTAQIFVNDKLVLTKHFTRADTLGANSSQVHLESDRLQPGVNRVRISKSGSGTLYWSARGEYYSAEKRLFQRNKLSLSLTRDYFRLIPQEVPNKESGGNKIVYRLEPVSRPVQSGDVLAVRLTVGGDDWRYLLVEDPIPAGVEFIQKDDSYELAERPDWWSWWYARREFHDDHAAFFQTYFHKKQEYTYLLKVINPGMFHVSPASAQPMYQPEILSTTDPVTLEVK